MIIAGERRYPRGEMAGKTKVPVVVRSYTEREVKEISPSSRTSSAKTSTPSKRRTR